MKASSTYLGSVAPPRELYATPRLREQVPLWSFTHKLKDPGSIKFLWDETRLSFSSFRDWRGEPIPTEPRKASIKYIARVDGSHGPGFSIGSLMAHEGDFVYAHPRQQGSGSNEQPTLPFDVWQVDRVTRNLEQKVRVRLRFFRRQAQDVRLCYDDPSKMAKQPFKDDRLLIPTTETVTYFAGAPELSMLCGRCYVVVDAGLLRLECHEKDTFIVHEDEIKKSLGSIYALKLCASCTVERKRQAATAKRIQSKPLKTLDIFAGAGGLAIGLEQSGIAKTRWALEKNKLAAQTFRLHKPDALVLEEDTNPMLQRVLLGHSTGLPRPTSEKVELIVGGPPCQGFSRLNRQASNSGQRDGRALMVANFVSWVDVYRPRFVLFENVTGFLQRKLGGHEKGYVKFLLLSLMSMNYAVSVSIVQSGSYGCPQSRHRVIVWGAKVGNPLPAIPSPTHVFLGQSKTSILWRDRQGAEHRSGPDWPRSAPLPAITIGDAISDLPRFDWRNPHRVYEETREEWQARAERLAANIPVYHVKDEDGDGGVGWRSQEYATKPKTRFQQTVRWLSPRAVQHQTQLFSALTVERVTSVPLVAGADYTIWMKRKPKLALRDSYDYCVRMFERLSFDDAFSVALTEISPTSKDGRVLHPSQHRVLTMREHARSQGFPDSVHFAVDATGLKGAHRQIGNAVAVPLARQLGQGLLDALVATELGREEERGTGRLVVDMVVDSSDTADGDKDDDVLMVHSEFFYSS